MSNGLNRVNNSRTGTPRLNEPSLLTRRAFALAAGALAVYTRPVQATKRFAWPNGAKGAVSLTYDDGCDSQLENAVPVLDALGFKATFFLTVENIEARVDEWIAVGKDGHEIGDHTMTHPCQLHDYSVERFEKEQINPAERYLDTHFGGPKPRSFAYPCGFAGLGRGATAARARRYTQALRSTFLAARTVIGPPNDPRFLPAERYYLNGYEPTYDSDQPHDAAAYVQMAVQSGHWAILIFHDVLRERKTSEDTSKAVHRAILENISRQPVWCAPLRSVFGYATGVV